MLIVTIGYGDILILFFTWFSTVRRHHSLMLQHWQLCHAWGRSHHCWISESMCVHVHVHSNNMLQWWGRYVQTRYTKSMARHGYTSTWKGFCGDKFWVSQLSFIIRVLCKMKHQQWNLDMLGIFVYWANCQVHDFHWMLTPHHAHQLLKKVGWFGDSPYTHVGPRLATVTCSSQFVCVLSS